MNPSGKPEIRLSTIASVRSVLLHLRQQNELSYFDPSIHHRRPRGPPPSGVLNPTRETDRVSKKSKRKLTDRQERRRIEGLRILARIIARHYLANPHLYRNGATPANGQPTDGGEAVREEGGA